MEEAKQRMALSLPAREGGVRPNSFTAMGSRSLFDGSPWGDDPSAFLLEQFRRRNKRRMEVPAAPHPELTPQQKQHISDRSEQGMSGSMSSIQQLPRRLLPNGSVAERVLMFEKSPSMFGDVRVPPQRKEPQLTGTSITSTPWRASAQDLQVGFFSSIWIYREYRFQFYNTTEMFRLAIANKVQFKAKGQRFFFRG